MGGRSRSSNTTSSSQTSNVQNLNLQDIDGVAVAGVDGDVSITSTDQGTVSAARDIVIATIEEDSARFNETVDLAADVVNAARAQTETIAGTALTITQEGLDFGGAVVSDAFISAEEQTERVLNFARDAQTGVFELVEDSNARSLDFAGDLSQGFRDSIGDIAGDALNRNAQLVGDVTQGFQDSVGDITSDFLNLGAQLIGETREFVGDAGRQVIGAVNEIQARESTNVDARLQEVTRFAIIAAGVISLAAIATQFRK